MTANWAKQFLSDLQTKLAEVKYPGDRENPRVSIGAYVVGVDCYLTDAEIRERANATCTTAKKERNRTVIRAENTEDVSVPGPAA